jgi:hypothetical protein
LDDKAEELFIQIVHQFNEQVLFSINRTRFLS